MRTCTALGLLLIFFYDGSEAVLEYELFTLGCKNYDNPSPLLSLKRHLFCQYDRTIRPTLSHQIVNNVTMKLLPKLLEFDEWNGRMTLHSWMSLTWTDSYLSWKPSDFDGLNFIHVKSDEIWVPDLSVYNSGDMAIDQTGIPSTTCLIFSSGLVSCVPSTRHTAKCSTNFTHWPYDTHNCRINFGSWSHSGEEVNFHLDKQPCQMDGYTNNSQWDLKVVTAYKVLKKYNCCPNDTYPMIVYEFSISRHYGMMHTTYVIPAIAMMLLTLTVLWLDSSSTERMAVACVNLICHILCIFDLHPQLPHNGTNPPNILLYYRDSLALSVFALILTALLRKIREMSIEVPNWIAMTTTFLLNNRAGRFFVLVDDDSRLSSGGILEENEENSDLPKTVARTKESSWKHFAAIIEWTSFFAVVVTYIDILTTLVPAT